VKGRTTALATWPTEEATAVVAVMTLEHPLKPAIKNMSARQVRLIVFMTGISQNLLSLATVFR
jgi:hypothetical protein